MKKGGSGKEDFEGIEDEDEDEVVGGCGPWDGMGYCTLVPWLDIGMTILYFVEFILCPFHRGYPEKNITY